MPHTEVTDPEREEWCVPNLLTREIVRQGVLLAAREEFGAATRDETLREPLSAPGEPSHFDFDVKHVQAKRIDYALRQGGRVLVDGTFPYQFGHAHAIEAMQAEAVEALSRGDFADGIAQAGLTRRRRVFQLDTPLPPEIEAALDRMDLFSQYEAVRLAHEAMEGSGESMALLGALARGYANLAQLTAYHHSSMRHAFAARAMLYATRLIRVNKTSPQGYWNRAYAFTLTGLTKASMFDLEKADEIRKEHDPGAAPPSWLKLVEMANEYDYPGLNLHVRDEGEHLNLAALLWFRSVEFSNSQALTVEVARRALAVNPYCLRIMQGADRAAGVAFKHMTSSVTFPIYAEYIVGRLPQLAEQESILADVLKASDWQLDAPNGRSRFSRRLARDAGIDRDLHEPSLAVLARLINEEDMLYVGMRASFLQDYLGTDSAPFLNEMHSVYHEHPLGFLISSLRLSQGLPVASYERFTGDVEIKESNIISSGPFFWRFPDEARFKNMTNREYHVLRWRQVCTTDLEYQYGISTAAYLEMKVQKAKWMFDMNPHAPYRYVVLIEHDWENSREHLDEWEERYGHHPAVALALGKQYEAEGQLDKAEQYYTDYVAAIADYEAYRRLARLYHRRGEKQKMLDIASAFLEEEDYGLSHAQMSKLIAYTLMAQGDYEAALPWAQRSADSYSGWGLQTLADCYEGLGKLDDARQVCEAIDERYGSSSVYDFVVRTGHGDLQQAWQQKLAHLLLYIQSEGQGAGGYRAFQSAVEGKLPTAVKGLMPIYEQSGDPEIGCLVAALAMRSGEDETARAVFERMQSSKQLTTPEAEPLKELIDYLLKGLDTNELNSQELRRLTEKMTGRSDASMEFLAAAFLDSHADRQSAIEHYREAARSPYREGFAAMLSWIRLRELGEDPLTLTPHYAGIEADESTGAK